MQFNHSISRSQMMYNVKKNLIFNTTRHLDLIGHREDLPLALFKFNSKLYFCGSSPCALLSGFLEYCMGHYKLSLQGVIIVIFYFHHLVTWKFTLLDGIRTNIVLRYNFRRTKMLLIWHMSVKWKRRLKHCKGLLLFWRMLFRTR